jgi:CO/xanthine dehydrogenase Mo-binding subunit
MMNEMRTVGKSVLRDDAHSKVTGEAQYANDVNIPGILHIKQVFAGRPHARILSIDTSAALEHPGVVAVLTAKDVPFNLFGSIVVDQPVLAEDKVCFEGDQVCAVVAETEVQAAAGARLVKIDYQDLPVVDDPLEAMKAGAVLVHDDKPGNLAARSRLRRGDVDAALAASDVVITREYRTPMQEHAFLEPEAGIGYIDEEGRVTVRTTGQSTHDDQQQIANALKLPLDKVRVIYGAIGGAFGGREEISMQVVIALAAWKLQRPVKLVWSREESIRGHGKRHAMILRHTWGASKDGILLAAKVELIADGGAYILATGDVIKNTRFAGVGPYQIPNVSIDAYGVYTNNIPGGAFRGFGSPQTGFAAEMQIEHLAEALGIDPVTFRLRNCLRDDSIMPTQTPVPGGVSLADLLETCAIELGARQEGDAWHMPVSSAEHTYKKRGFGFGVGVKNSGFGYGFPEGADGRVVLYGGADIERAEVYTAAADVGQGAHTVLAQIAAEALNIPMEKIEMITSDTVSSGPTGPASASRLTLFAGNAVKQAAEQALQSFMDENRPAEGGGRWDAPPTEPPDPETGACFSSLSYSYGAHGVEVEVDTETGQIRLLNVVSVNDPGKAINPQMVVGQIQGTIVQSQGWALLENFVTEGGYIQTDTLSTYLIPTVLDIPDREKTILLEKPDPLGPYGVRGVGEIPFVSLPPAVVSAVHNATGVWFDHLPLRPQDVAAALQST